MPYDFDFDFFDFEKDPGVPEEYKSKKKEKESSWFDDFLSAGSAESDMYVRPEPPPKPRPTAEERTPKLSATEPETFWQKVAGTVDEFVNPRTPGYMAPSDIADAQIKMEARKKIVKDKTDEGKTVFRPRYKEEYMDEVDPDNSGVRKATQLFKDVGIGALSTAEGMAGGAQWLTDGIIGGDLANQAKLWGQDLSGEEQDFSNQLAQGVGSMGTFFVPGIGVMKGATAVAKISPKLAQWMGAGTMTALEAMTEAGSVYRDVLNETKDPLRASLAATETFTLNVPLLTITNKLGIFGESGSAIKRALVSSLMEGGQEAGQEIISTTSAGKTVKWGDVLTSGAIGAIIGGGTGAVSHGLMPKMHSDAITDDQKAALERAAAANEVPGDTDGSFLTRRLIESGSLEDVKFALAPENAKLWTPEERSHLERHYARLQATESPTAKLDKTVDDHLQGKTTSTDLLDAFAGEFDNLEGLLQEEPADVNARKIRYGDKQPELDLGTSSMPLFDMKDLSSPSEIVDSEASGEAVNLSMIPGTSTTPVIIERRGVKEGGFYAPEGESLADFGEDTHKFELADASKIYKGEASYEFVKDRVDMNASDPILDEYGLKNWQQFFDDFGLYEVGNDKWGFSGNENFKALQDKAEQILKAQGYQGAEWSDEDALNPHQYQIWDRSILKEPAKSKGQNDLATEALKHKTAEEFVKAKVNAYHGTSSEEFDEFRGDVAYFTREKGEAKAFSTNPIIGGGRGVGTPRVLEVALPEGKTKNIDEGVQEVIMEEHPDFDNLDEYIAHEAKIARKEGYDYLAFNHPSSVHGGEFEAIVAVNPKKVKTRKQLEEIHKAAAKKTSADLDVSKIVTEEYRPYSQKNPGEGGNYEWKRVDRSQIGKTIKQGPEADYEDYTIDENAAYGQVEVTEFRPHEIEARKKRGIDINEKTKTAITNSFELAPDLRGKGLGRKLWQKIEDDARKHGAERMEIWHVMSDAIGFWRKMGFKPIAGGSEDARTWVKEKEDFLPKAKTPTKRKDTTVREEAGEYGIDLEGIGGKLNIREADAPYEAPKKADTFYSQMAQILDKKLPNQGTPAQFRTMINAWAQKGEFKAEELKWSGVDEWLAGKKEKVTKQDVVDYIKANQIQIEEVTKGTQPSTIDEYSFASDYEPHKTIYASYQLPGGENYRELLLTLPERSTRAELDAEARKIAKRDGLDYDSLSEGEQRGYRRTAITEHGSDHDAKVNYHSSHWSEPNVLLHVRMNDRIDVDGKKVLFLEEVQSDWHQEGRRKGYRGEAVEAMLKKYPSLPRDADTWSGPVLQEAGLTVDEISDVIDHFNNAPYGVPQAPFAKTWHELGMKRMLRYAAENGYDRIAWTTGEQQAERYDLSTQIDSLTYTQQSSDGMFPGRVRAYPKRGNQAPLVKDVNSEAELIDVMGKQMAEKIIGNQGQRSEHMPLTQDFRGLDLKVGGEGMAGFYDKILPTFMNKYVKKWGSQVGKIEIPVSGVNEYGEQIDESLTPNYIVPVHSVDITPAMRKDVVTQGQALYENKSEYGAKKPDRAALEKQWRIVMGVEKGKPDPNLPTDRWELEELLGEMDEAEKKGKFYSNTASMLEQQGETAMPPAEWKKRIEAWGQKFAGIREENQWSGLLEYIDSRSDEKKIPKADLLEYMEETKKGWLQWENEPDNRWSSRNLPGAIPGTEQMWIYSLPGGTSGLKLHRDIMTEILTAEDLRDLDSLDDVALRFLVRDGTIKPGDWGHFDTDGGALLFATPQRRAATREAAQQDFIDYLQEMEPDSPMLIPADADTYSSPHFPYKPNVLLHIRTQKMLDSKGRIGIVAETIQSDWHQEGRDKGYRRGENTVTVQETDDGKFQVYLGETPVGVPYNRRQDAEKNIGHPEYLQGHGAVPDAPFKDTWHEQGLKRLIDIAAKDPEVEWIGWTPGEAQAERWGKANKRYIGKVEYFEVEPGQYTLNVQYVDANHLAAYGLENTSLREAQRYQNLDQIKNEWGSEIADAIRRKEGLKTKASETELEHGIIDIDRTMTVGGDYLKLLYDKKLPKFADKYVKKWGAKVEDIETDAGEIKNGRMLTNSIHAIRITPQMREEITTKGQAFYEPKATYAARAIKALNKAVDFFTGKRVPGPGVLNRSGKTTDRTAAGVRGKEKRHHTVGKMVDDLKNLKPVRLRGADVRTWDEAYEALRITRNKNVEVLQVLYLGAESGKVLYNEACSSRLPGAVHIASPAILASSIHATSLTLKRIAGEGVRVALVHNHPSGDVTASEADKAMTESVGKQLKIRKVEFEGHMIIDHNTYGVIEDGGKYTKRSITDIPAEHAQDPLLSVPVPHDKLGETITRQEHVASIAKDINRGDKYFTILMRSGTKVRGIVNIELGILDEPQQAQAYIKELMVNHGAQDAFVYREEFTDRQVYVLQDLVKGNTIRDAAWEGRWGTQGVAEQGIFPDSSRQFGEDISEQQSKWFEDYGSEFREGKAPYGSETDMIISQAKKNGTYMKAPNGQPTKLNPGQWAQVRTKAFKEWFGDWEHDPKNASKVVDENGEPLVMYHGTDNKFDVFDTSDKSLDFEVAHALGENIGSFFAAKENDAKDFGRNVQGFYVSLKNPKVFKDQNEFRAFMRENSGRTPDIRDADGYIVQEGVFENNMRSALETAGHDGVVIKNPQYSAKKDKPWVVAFSPEQIKSATGNRGTFDANEGSILKEPGAEYESGRKEYVKVYRGITGREKQGEPLLVTTDKAIAKSHGKILAEAYVKRSKIKSGPEELAFYDGKVPPEKMGSIEALVEEDDLIPANEFGRLSDKDAPYGEDLGEPEIDDDLSFEFGANVEKAIDENPEEYISLDFKDHLDGYMGALQGLVFQGEPGKNFTDADTGEVSWYSSTYPEFMQDQGWTSKEVLSALGHSLRGEEMTDKQRAIVQAAVNQAVEMFYEDLNRWYPSMTGKQYDKAEASIQKATDAFLSRYYTNQKLLKQEKEKVDRATMITKSKYQWEKEKKATENKAWEKGAKAVHAVQDPLIKKLQEDLDATVKQRDNIRETAYRLMNEAKMSTTETKAQEEANRNEIEKLNRKITRLKESLAKARKAQPKKAKQSTKALVRISTGQNLNDQVWISEYKLLTEQIRREAMAARQAFAAGNKKGLLAARARYKMLQAQQRAMREIRRETNKIIKDFKKVLKETAEMTPEYADKIRALLEDFDLRRMTGETRLKLEAIRDALVEDPNADIDERTLDTLKRLEKIPIRDISYPGLKAMHDAVMHFATLGKRGPMMIMSQKKVMRDMILKTSIDQMRPAKDVAKEMVDATYSGWKEVKARLAAAKDLYTIHLDTFDNLVESIAGQNSMAYRVLMREIKRGSNERDRIAYDLEDDFMAAHEAFQKRHPEIKDVLGWLSEEVDFAGIRMNRNLALSLYRGWFDPDYQRSIIESGFGLWGSQDRDNPNRVYKIAGDAYGAAVNKLSAADREYADLAIPTIQKSGDLLADKFLEINGYAMPRVEGGIYWRKEVLASERGQDEEQEQMKERFGRPYIFKGMTKKRTGSSAAVWLKPYTVAVREMHKRAADYVGLEEAMGNAAWLMYNSEFRSAFEERYGRPMWRELEKGLKDIAEISTPEASGDMERFFRWLRNNSTIYALAANYGTMLKQLNGAFNYMVYVGPGYLTRAISAYASNPMAVKRLHRSMSVEYRRRRESGYSQDVGNVLQVINKQGTKPSLLTRVGAGGLVPLQQMDIFGVDLGMLAATYQAMDAFKTGKMPDQMRMALDMTDAQVAKLTTAEKAELAYRWADFVTERTQSQNVPEHMSGWQRGGELEKQLSMFFGELQKNLAGFTRGYRAVKRGNPGAKALLLKTILLYAILGTAIDTGVNELRNWFRGRKGDKWWAALLKSATGYLPGVREVVSGVVDMAQGKYYAGGGDTPFERVRNATEKPLKATHGMITATTMKKRRDNAKKFADGLANFVAMTVGIPYPAMKEPFRIWNREEELRKARAAERR